MADARELETTLNKLRQDAKARKMDELVIAYGWSLMRCKYGGDFMVAAQQGLAAALRKIPRG